MHSKTLVESILILVPHSFGGMIARRYASTYPEDVRVYEETFINSYRKLLDLSNQSRHVTAEGSSHLINDFDPWLAIEGIEKITRRSAVP